MGQIQKINKYDGLLKDLKLKNEGHRNMVVQGKSKDEENFIDIHWYEKRFKINTQIQYRIIKRIQVLLKEYENTLIMKL